MRKVEKQMAEAWWACMPMTCGNSRIRVHHDGTVIATLHDNVIARRDPDGERWYSMAGWNTMTTKSRLNALLPYYARIFTHKGETLLDLSTRIIPMLLRDFIMVPNVADLRPLVRDPLDRLTLALLAKQERKRNVYGSHGAFHVRCAKKIAERDDSVRFQLDDHGLDHGTRCMHCYNLLGGL